MSPFRRQWLSRWSSTHAVSMGRGARHSERGGGPDGGLIGELSGMSATSDHHDFDEIEREEGLDMKTVVEDAVELFEQPVQSPAADADVPPPG